MKRNPFNRHGGKVKPLVEQCPPDGCMFIFNATPAQVQAWRSTGTRLGYHVYLTDPHVCYGWRSKGIDSTNMPARDLYIAPRDVEDLA